MCIHCSLRKQKCRLKSTTTNGWRHFGQLEQRKPSVLFPIQSEKSPDSGFFTCDPTKKCIMPSSRERLKGIIGRGHDLRLRFVQNVKLPKSTFSTQLILVPRATQPRDQETTGSGDENGRDVLTCCHLLAPGRRLEHAQHFSSLKIYFLSRLTAVEARILKSHCRPKTQTN